MNKRILLMSACLGLASAASAARDFHWYFYPIDTAMTPVDTENMTTGPAKLRYDSKGTAKVAYVRPQKQIYYAELDGNNWKWQKVDSGLNEDSRISMDLDNAGMPHIIYEPDGYKVIRYAGYDGKDWIRKNLDTILDPGFGNYYTVDIKLDSKKNLHLFYPRRNSDNDGNNGATYARVGTDLNRARRDSLCSCVSSSGKWGGLILDSKENPVIAYYRNDKEKFQVAHLKGGEPFAIDSVIGNDVTVPYGQYASIGRDENDSIYISHHKRDPANLLMTSGRPGGPYKTENIAPLGGSPLWNTPSPITVAKNGVPYIAYVNCVTKTSKAVSEAKLRIAWKKDGVWQTETVDSTSAITGLWADIALNKDGLPSIVYFNYSKRQLWLAVAKPDAPVDANNNGILDYQETPIGTIGLIKNRLGRTSSNKTSGKAIYDTMGRKSGKSLPRRAGNLIPSSPVFSK